MAKATLLQSDIDLVSRLLEDESAWGASSKEFSRKILQALYDNDSKASIAATRGIIVIRGNSDCYWGVGPYATVGAAKKASAEMFGGAEGARVMHLRHPWHYSKEGREVLDGVAAGTQDRPQPRTAKAA